MAVEKADSLKQMSSRFFTNDNRNTLLKKFNRFVDRLFDLAPAEIGLIESSPA